MNQVKGVIGFVLRKNYLVVGREWVGEGKFLVSEVSQEVVCGRYLGESGDLN